MNQNRQLAQATSKQTLENKEEEELQGEKNMVGNTMTQVPLLLFCLDKAYAFRSAVTILTHAYEQLWDLWLEEFL